MGHPAEHIKPNFGFAPAVGLLQFINRAVATVECDVLSLAESTDGYKIIDLHPYMFVPCRLDIYE